MKTEEVITALITTLTGLTTTGDNVLREKVYDIDSAALPMLVVIEGDDVVEDQLSQSFIDWNLSVDIDIIVRGDRDEINTLLNTIRNEIQIALMADYKLGLSFVKFISVTKSSSISTSTEGDMPISKKTISYEIRYRTNWANFN